MAEFNRDCCLFYKSYIEAGERLKDPEKELKLYKDIFAYGTTHKEPSYEDDPLLDMAWCFIKPLLDANLRNYLNGIKGGAPKGNKNAKKTKNNQNNRNQPPVEKKQGNVTVTDTVNEKDTVTVTDTDNDNDTYMSLGSLPLEGQEPRHKLQELKEDEWI